MGSCCSSSNTTEYTGVTDKPEPEFKGEEEHSLQAIQEPLSQVDFALSPTHANNNNKVIIPLVNDQKPPAVVMGMIQPFNPSNVHIVVCDDDRSSKTLAKWLSEKKYHVTRCLDGNEAVAVLKKASQGVSQIEDINAILTDTEMQTDSGLKVLDYVKMNPSTSHIPVVLMSADTTPQAMDRCIRRGGSDFITKPITKQVLLKTVQRTCETDMEVQNILLLRTQGDKYKREIIRLENNKLQKAITVSQNALLSPMFEHKVLSDRVVPKSPNLYDESSKSRQWSETRLPISTVLLIDSDPHVRDEAQNWLEATGFINVLLFANNDSALEYIHEADNNGEQFELIMVDAGMDEDHGVTSKTGLYFLDEIAKIETCADVPVILMGNISPQDMTEAVRHGCDTFLTKPLTKDLTVKKTSSLLQIVAQKRKTTQLYERAQNYKNLLDGIRKDNVDNLRTSFSFETSVSASPIPPQIVKTK